MMKIPRLFQTNTDGSLIPKVTPGCEWVMEGTGIATEKLDGQNVIISVDGGTVVDVQVFSEIDYLPLARRDVGIKEAIERMRFARWADGRHECEVIGPTIRNDRYRLREHQAFPLDWRFLPYLPINIEIGNVEKTLTSMIFQMPVLRSVVRPGSYTYAEGVVWYHLDGRVAQLSVEDFL